MAIVLTGVVNCVLIIAQAFALVGIVVPVFTEGADLAAVTPAVITLSVVVVARAVVSYLSEYWSLRAAARAKSELRQATMRRLMALSPVWMTRHNTGRLTQLLTRGIDGLDAYFARYLPQLVLTMILPPVIGVVILTQDLTAALIVLVTVPLIPVFMALIGIGTKRRVDRQWRTLGVLAGHFLDILAGMATLKAFGRARAQAGQVRRISDEYRRTTMGVLKLSFLSSLALELIAMLSVALVAVSIGLRLVDGNITLAAGLLVLVLVPEVYLPLRQVGLQYHAAAEGLGAAGELVAILEQADAGPEVPADGDPGLPEMPDLSSSVIRFRNIVVDYGRRGRPALDGINFEVEPGRITALVGPSGSGKSTVLALLARFVEPTSGDFQVDADGRSIDISRIEPALWRTRICWIGQQPHLLPGSLAENVRLAAPTATDEQVIDALAAVGLDSWMEHLPAGLDTRIGDGGRSLSAGQARRIAFARILCADPQLVLLDEPTAALDGDSEDELIEQIVRLAEGRTVVIVAHRESLMRIADVLVEVRDGQAGVLTAGAEVGRQGP
ncbi:MAG: thiol reductant ABC exporter subunit CydD [Candidatus Nanopelagicales bacterium]|nr:thiol reductant ABC exporter subunit CydD [Candidatus Nanopelagicales bacterium]